MKEINFNDQLGSRSRRTVLLLFVEDTVILFTGYNIPGIAVITNQHYNQNGKWSSTTYQIAIPDNVLASQIVQDFENGSFVPANNWQDAYKEFKEETKFPVSLESFHQFISATWESIASRLNETEKEIKGLGNASEVVEAEKERQQVKTQVLERIRKEEEKLEVARLNNLTTGIKTKLAGKCSLEELKDLLKSMND